MPNIHIRKIIYRLQHQYLTLNNVVIAVALLIAANWMWNALEVMQRNYTLQREVDTKQRELLLVQLQRDSLALEGRYYKTEEYQELAVRQSLGLVMPGEKTLLLPATETVDATSQTQANQTGVVDQPSNFEQWLNFLFGGNNQRITEGKGDE